MSIIKSFSVGLGDMFYIRHNSDNFSIIDCCLPAEIEEAIVDELIAASSDKNVTRFISTHPDEDHLRGLTYLDGRMEIANFYCVENAAMKADESDDFIHYCARRDSADTFHLYQGCTRRWMNKTTDERGSAGLNVVWPLTNNPHYREALKIAAEGGSPNNISIVMSYTLEDGVTALWMGDIETDFMENVADAVTWPRADIMFAPHHGRLSGRVPHALLDQIKPKIIVLGEAPSRHLHYYGGYNIITQNSAGDIWMECLEGKVRLYVSEPGYEVDFLDEEESFQPLDDYYIGTLTVG